jgi:hypothetical protein
MSVSAQEIRKAIDQVKEILGKLESKLGSADASAVDPYVRRREILQRIYWNDNSMRRDDLMALLRDFGTNYAWIGQQVRKGYLIVLQAPGGTRYSVTQKGIRDEGLQEHDEELDKVSAMSSEAFGEDWDSEEDSAYDSL